MKEADMRRALLKKFRLANPMSHVVAVENDVLPGYPDVEGVVNRFGFVIELKLIQSWPVRPRTPVRINHFTKEQKLFLRSRWRAGGAAFLLLRVVDTKEWLLFSGPNVREIGDSLTNTDLLSLAEKVWVNSIDAKELVTEMKVTRNGL
ncbi:hypothetical protein KAR91_14950 [Candidatus Pacearchaeota archaeon]|nr:hypothetical protein [Candidatus Pacearchaeota archaeon]